MKNKNKILILIFFLLIVFVCYEVISSKKLSDYLPVNIKSYTCSSYQESKMPNSKANKIFDFLKNNVDRFKFSRSSCLTSSDGLSIKSLPDQAYDFNGDFSFTLSLFNFNDKYKVLEFQQMVDNQKIFFQLESIELIKKFEDEINKN